MHLCLDWRCSPAHTSEQFLLPTKTLKHEELKVCKVGTGSILGQGSLITCLTVSHTLLQLPDVLYDHRTVTGLATGPMSTLLPDASFWSIAQVFPPSYPEKYDEWCQSIKYKDWRSECQSIKCWTWANFYTQGCQKALVVDETLIETDWYLKPRSLLRLNFSCKLPWFCWFCNLKNASRVDLGK